MNQSPPPLHLLNTFEVAARLLSFKKAASELHVSPPAVSQQIKLLEESVGEALFHREAGGVFLTPVGSQLYHLAENVLSRYRNGYRTLYQTHEAPVLRISTMSVIVADVLIPALPSFQQKYPQIELRLETCEEFVDLDASALCGAIRIGTGNWPNLNCIKLCDLRASAVASPSLLEKYSFSSAEDIQKIPLIHSRTYVDDWQRASKETGIDFSKNKQLYFDNLLAAMAAAERGMGVALASFPISNALVQSGRLVPLLETAEVEEACYFVYPPGLEDDNNLQKLISWLVEVFEDLSNQRLS